MDDVSASGGRKDTNAFGPLSFVAFVLFVVENCVCSGGTRFDGDMGRGRLWA